MELTFGEPEAVDISLIYDGPDGQARAGTCPDTVQRYAADMAEGDQFPPVMLVKVGVDEYRVADGHHRIGAAKLNDEESITAQIATGSADDALLYGATKANRENAKELTRADYRRRASLVMRRPEFAADKVSASELGRMVGSSRTSIAAYRRLPLGKPTVEPPAKLQAGTSYELIFDDGKHGRLVELYWEADQHCWTACHAVAATDAIAEDGDSRWPIKFWNEELAGSRHFYVTQYTRMYEDDGAFVCKHWRLVEVREFLAREGETRNYRGGKSTFAIHHEIKRRGSFREWWDALSPDQQEAQFSTLKPWQAEIVRDDAGHAVLAG